MTIRDQRIGPSRAAVRRGPPPTTLADRIAVAQAGGPGPIAVEDPARIWRYTVSDEGTYRLWRWHVERTRKSAVITVRDSRREAWIGGIWLGKEPLNPPPAVPLLGRLLWPLLRWLLRHDLMGQSASAALRRVFEAS